MPTLYTIPVSCGPRRYDVLIGVNFLNRLPPAIRRLGLGTHPILVTNSTLAKNHARKVEQVLRAAGFPVTTLTIADTERSKSLPTLGRLLTRLAALDGPGVRLFLVLVGGGVVGDLGGLAAGLYRRGVPFVQVPTTLLAQVDSSIGGKTGVDLPHGKNLVGLIVQPQLVFIDLAFLRSLSQRQLRSGLAEVAKCGVIRDPTLVSFLERTPFALLRRSSRSLGWLVARAVRVKVGVVQQDERESKGIRMILNFGHTLGHAIEAATHYSSAYTHGEAIGIGMIAATDLSRRLGLIQPGVTRRIDRLIRRIGLPTVLRGVSLRNVMKAMSHDKKWSAAPSRWVLPAGIGRVVVKDDVPIRIVTEVVRDLMEKR